MRLSTNCMLVITVLFLLSCAHNPGPLRKVMEQVGDVRTPNTIPLFIDTEIDRSGNDYHRHLRDFDLQPLRDRLVTSLSEKEVKFRLETLQANVYSDVRYTNPFVPVDDSSKARMILRLSVDGFLLRSEHDTAQQAFGMALSAPRGMAVALRVSVRGVSVESQADVFEFFLDAGSRGKFERDATDEILDIMANKILSKVLKP